LNYYSRKCRGIIYFLTFFFANKVLVAKTG
jgi:hypothetical protein